jgi:hypothetical protein
MTQPDSKRRLGMMPEVLPEPRPMSGAGDARTRTVAHMQRLLATVAAAGAAVGACAQEPNPVTAPIDTGSGASDGRDAATYATSDPSGTPPATDSASDVDADVPPIPSVPTTGYAVVDPVPPPSVCPQAAAQIHATAKWKAAKGGLVVVVDFAKGRGPDKISYSAQSTPSGYGATVVTTSGAGDTKRFVLAPNPNQTAVSVGVPALCNGQPINISLGLDLQKPPKAGDAIPLNLSSY